MKKTELAYAAGIIDGEGTIQLAPYTGAGGNRRYFHLRVSVGNTNEWLIRWLQFNFGGSIIKCKVHPDKNWKPAWRWTLACRQSRDFLLLILPYLKIKRPQADLAIKWQEKRVKVGSRPTEKERAWDEAQQIVMTAYNKRGRA